jgi:hypothetical protein
MVAHLSLLELDTGLSSMSFCLCAGNRSEDAHIYVFMKARWLVYHFVHSYS